MCGIIGGIAARDIAPILLEGLKRLEYRGYDSAGMSLLDQNKLSRVRVCGKVEALMNALEANPLQGKIGIAHTRWATHGQVSEKNAHPHMAGSRLALVHNGIIENHLELKKELGLLGVEFDSQTDTEVIVHALSEALKAQSQDLFKALQATLTKLQGAYALALLGNEESDHIIAARQGSPLVIGLGIGENFVASDILALLPVTQKFIVLEDGDLARVYADKVEIFNSAGVSVDRETREVALTAQHSEKGDYRHFMQKEIFEQPRAVIDTLQGRLSESGVQPSIFGANAPDVFPQVEQLHIVACGTSYHAGLVGQFWVEELLGIPCRVEIASEMRYQRQVARKNTLFVSLSQSGETADTLAALRSCQSNPNYLGSLSICNVPESSLVRESDMVLLTHAGPEIGVCSTKAFVTQLLGLMLLTLGLARAKDIEVPYQQDIQDWLTRLPGCIEAALELDAPIKKLAEELARTQHALFLGRGPLYPIAKEGALKLKEISYIHAESYPAGELKHGPLALVDENMPVIALACKDVLNEKLRSNLQEVKARHGQLYIFATQDCNMKSDEWGTVIEVPSILSPLAPFLLSIPMQLLAYHVAVLKGTDVDQPRNLAKSVTVE